MRFGFLRSDFGVDTSQSPATMVIAVGGDNFILVHDAKKVNLTTESRRITIKEIVDKNELDREISRIRFIGVSLGNSAVRKVIEFLIGIYAAFAQQNGKLFKITANSGGVATVIAKESGTGNQLKLAVTMLQRQDFVVDVRFPHALDENGKDFRLSNMPASHASDWLDEANVIFGPQLNIHFKLGKTSEPSLNQRISSLGPSKWDDLRSATNQDSKTITVYFSKLIHSIDGHPWGMSLIKKSRGIVMQDRDSEDELVKTLGHEFIHTLGDMKNFPIGHPGHKGDIMISYSRFDGVRISSELVSVLGKQ